jgi:hypothetical protein
MLRERKMKVNANFENNTCNISINVEEAEKLISELNPHIIKMNKMDKSGELKKSIEFALTWIKNKDKMIGDNKNEY